MARQRDPRREEAFNIYMQHNGDITNRAIADQLNLPEKTVGGWKSKDSWKDKLYGDSNGVLRKKPELQGAIKMQKTINVVLLTAIKMR
jgi:phage terminase small subunit